MSLAIDFKVETERLLLQPIAPEYREVIFKEFTPEIATHMMPQPAKEIAETKAFITSSIEKMNAGKEITCVIIKKTTGEFLGCSGLHNIDSAVPEPGIWLKKSAHGYGYGREAIGGLKKWADTNLQYDSFSYPVAPDNTASRKIPLALGGVVVREYDQADTAGTMKHWLEYSIPKNKPLL